MKRSGYSASLILPASLLIALTTMLSTHAQTTSNRQWTYPIVDTNQRHVFSDQRILSQLPHAGQKWYGEDAQYSINPPQYQDNHDGTITDLVTGLMWEKGIHDNVSFRKAQSMASTIRTGGYSDWRLPTIKELYSLMDFNGCVTTKNPVPYLNTKYFDFKWGNEVSSRNRIIDAQFWSDTQYVGTTMGGNATVFGVNFADGRIKGYPRDRKETFVRYVRGNPDYGINKFIDNHDGTISDNATGLMWAKVDSKTTYNWENALKYAEKITLAGHSDWRLPNAKELQSLVDYTRAPQARDALHRGPAIDPIFTTTKTESYFWTSTTHLDGVHNYDHAVYIAFGRAMGNFAPPHSNQSKQWMDVHGAGAQRSDPKSGNPKDARYVSGRGPQGDDIRIYNYVRVVRNINPDEVSQGTLSTSAVPVLEPQPGMMSGGQNNNQSRPPMPGRMPPPRR
jgi:hypothetical protein